jgi:polyphosphate kinase
MLELSHLPTLPSLLLKPGVPLIHRDISWLQFNERVLQEARQTNNPLLERLKFLSITQSNIDEFFMIRLSSLTRAYQKTQRPGGQQKQESAEGEGLKRVMDGIFETVTEFTVKQAETLDLIRDELGRFSISVHLLKDADPAIRKMAQRIFYNEVLPALPEPHVFSPSKLRTVQNLQLFAILGEKKWMAIPRNLPSVLLHQTGEQRFHLFFLDDLIATFIHEARGLEGSAYMMRLTRDGDFTVDFENEEIENVPDVVRSHVRTREKGSPSRLQYRGGIPDNILASSIKALRLSTAQSFSAPQTLCLHGLFSVVNKLSPVVSKTKRLAHRPLKSSLPPHFENEKGLFEALREQDVLLHHPYDSFEGVVEFIRAAALDPQVKMIEQTVYRMDAKSPIIEILKDAAKRKKVRALIELRARFDEMNNLRLAEDLSQAGVEVAFGFGKLKLHAKIALVTRQERGKTKLYTHLATGNYNSITAKAYTDLGILTSNDDIGADARYFFDSVIRGVVPTQFRQLVPAPMRLHRKLQRLIRSEMVAARRGETARIVAKVNALVDEAIIELLYEASQAGVQIELLVRGACSLIPGVKGLSDNIRVTSIVDRFLEHSRIYYFENAGEMYLSSADWMPRNFFSRLELAFPVLDPRLYSYLRDVVIPIYLEDRVKARELTPEGLWRLRSQAGTRTPIRAQFRLEELAERQYKGTPLE